MELYIPLWWGQSSCFWLVKPWHWPDSVWAALWPPQALSQPLVRWDPAAAPPAGQCCMPGSPGGGTDEISFKWHFTKRQSVCEISNVIRLFRNTIWGAFKDFSPVSSLYLEAFIGQGSSVEGLLIGWLHFQCCITVLLGFSKPLQLQIAQGSANTRTSLVIFICHQQLIVFHA